MQYSVEAFERMVVPEPNTGCWLWLGAAHPWGYGSLRLNGRTAIAHRVAWLLYRGEIGAGLLVCHKCDVPGCVNPDHLFLGTPMDNTRDMHRKGRARKALGEAASRTELKQTEVLEMRRLYASGDYSAKDLSAKFGVSKATANAVVKGRSWRHLPLGEQPAKQKGRRLSASDIPLIRASLVAGERVIDIAARYKVHASIISNIKAGRLWRHIK
jgi:hypothetical protein